MSVLFAVIISMGVIYSLVVGVGHGIHSKSALEGLKAFLAGIAGTAIGTAIVALFLILVTVLITLFDSFYYSFG